MFELMFDLKGRKKHWDLVRFFAIFSFDLGMGENNCSWNRRLTLKRETLAAAQAIYQSRLSRILFIHQINNNLSSRYVREFGWIDSCHLSRTLFYWMEARSESSKYSIKFYMFVKQRERKRTFSFSFQRKALQSVARQMSRSRILTKFYHQKNKYDDQQLARVC